MNCLKCGKETEFGQVFCKECQGGMKKYPVNPNTAVHLPQRDPDWDKKATYEREPTEADVIRQLKRIIRWLTLTVGILALLLCLLAGLLFTRLGTATPDIDIGNMSDIGKNYSTVGTDDHT